MKRSKIILGFLLVLVLSLSIKFAEANSVRLITIQSDGSVVPPTEYVKREGNVYYLTQSISPARLVINCSNIVFDGQGYTINGSNYFVWGENGITLEKANNVTIRDVVVIGFYGPSISLINCSDVFVTRVQTDAKGTIAVDIADCIWLEQSNNNTISNCITGIRLQSGSNNHIFNNTLYLDILSSNNFFQHNNMNIHYADNGFKFPIIGLNSVNSWDDGLIGNYWTDYSGNGSYIIDENNVDHYPLINPVEINIQPPTSTPTATAILPPRNPPHLSPIYYLMPVAFIAAIVILSLLLY
jgi:parallel beta-helix repeat protein